ncbi:MAG: N-acetyltransferase [Actinomycetota bacterium]|nr:N-acetyltransferase [Actinomycetota bacterium]
MSTPAGAAPSAPVPVHVPERSRFEVVEPQGTAVLTYVRRDGEVVLEHTVVPEEIERRGVGSALVQAALGWAAGERLAVVPQCSFVRSWLERHPDVPVEVRPYP